MDKNTTFRSFECADHGNHKDRLVFPPRFYIGGSVASLFHRAARSTMDVDLVADPKAKDVDHFVSQIHNDDKVGNAAITDAIAPRSWFNLIHLPSSFKVDIWYRLGNEVSERQWDDVVRVMKMLGDRADHKHLIRSATDLKVADLLKKLLDLAR